MSKSQNNITLTRHIQWVIGNRIILCLALLSIAVLMTSTYDIISGFKQVKANLHVECSNLSEFVVAQTLIDNQAGINIKLDELNSANSGEKFEWRPNVKITNNPDIKWEVPFSWVYSYPVLDNDGKAYGEIRVTGSYFYNNSILIQLITKFSLLLFFSMLIFVLLYPLSNRIPQDLFIIPIMNLLDMLKRRSNVPKKK